MKTTNKITEFFGDVETTKEHGGYFHSVGEALTIIVLGSFCGLRNIKQIHQWASNERVSGFLRKEFEVRHVPCYSWLMSLLKIVKPESFNEYFIKWVQSLVGDDPLTISFDGKTVRSTAKMAKYTNPLHIISAQIGELGITLGQQAVEGKSNEIPAVRKLIGLLEIEGCMVVADALNCQRETAKAIRAAKADYLLDVKENQPKLLEEIRGYVQDEDLRQAMDVESKKELNRGRVETRTAYTMTNIEWLSCRSKWQDFACIGAIHSHFESKKGISDEWHYYISSRKLSAAQLLKFARLEWSVEIMHWLLDVHFAEDYCRVEDENIQRNLNMARKVALNIIKLHKAKKLDKRPISNIMLECLLELERLLELIDSLGS